MTIGENLRKETIVFQFFFSWPNRDRVVEATRISLTVKMRRVMDMSRIDSRFKILECNHGWQQSIGKRNTTTTKRYLISLSGLVVCILKRNFVQDALS